MSVDRGIREAVQGLAGTGGVRGADMMLATVLSYDVDSRTCSVQSVDENDITTLENVRLMTSVDDGLLYLPTVGSSVIVVKSKKNLYFVAMFSALDQVTIAAPSIQFGDGTFGGMVKGTEFQTQEAKTVQLLEALLGIINGAPIPEPGSGAPSALQAALKTAVSGLSVPDFTNAVNGIITHGQ